MKCASWHHFAQFDKRKTEKETEALNHTSTCFDFAPSPPHSTKLDFGSREVGGKGGGGKWTFASLAEEEIIKFS